MNTKLSVINTHKSKDNLIILADKTDLNWSNAYLSNTEQTFLKNAIKKGVSHVFFPQAERAIIVQFLKLNGDESINKEEARMLGNDILTIIEHYKLDTVTLVNHRPNNHVLEYLEGMLLGNYQFLKYFTKKKDKANSLQTIKVTKDFAPKKSIDELKAITTATCIARDLVNEPQSYLSAAQMSKDIQKIGKECGFDVEVFDEKKIKRLKMGGIIAVNMGSFTPPRFNILEWKPTKAKNKKPIVLVGKGIVYDTGGLSLKPTPNSMDKMKCDMGGAATVVGLLAAISKAKLPLHVVGLIPSTDNRPGNNAYAPGDVITMYDGTTVEVLNTDAEGRLVLADALHYAKKYKPELVMDFATLTGSAARAVGAEGTCYMGTAEKEVKDKVVQSGYNVYERLVEFPLWREYGDQMKSHIADLKNLGGPAAGMVTAAKFLQHFTDYPWLHFDLAGAAYLSKSNSYRTKEGTGVGVRMIFNFLKNY